MNKRSEAKPHIHPPMGGGGGKSNNPRPPVLDKRREQQVAPKVNRVRAQPRFPDDTCMFKDFLGGDVAKDGNRR